MAKPMKQEEKREKMLEIFEKHKSFFKMQELEKLGVKEKGIIEKTIKDVVLSLLYDDLICSEKVGTSTYYWSNNNKKLVQLIKDKQKLEQENIDLNSKISSIKKELVLENKNKAMTEQKVEKLNVYNLLINKIDEMSKELEEYSEVCVDEYKEKSEEQELIKEINKVTDNLFIIQDYVSNKFNMDKKDVCKNFNISEDMDYIE